MRPPGATEEAVLAFAQRAMALLAPPGTADEDALGLDRLAGDGSTRRIYRARLAGVTAIVVHNPLPADRVHPDENDGFLAVREFLDLRGVRVPAFFVADLERGLLLLEDLGDTRLYERVARDGWTAADPTPLYRDAIGSLVRMQRPASPAFDPAWAPNPVYDEEFIVTAEARYFHDELVRGLAGLDDDFAAVEAECRALARAALSGPGRIFLHRDYQSRNLMLTGRALAVIDFQGARLGPPEYDLAALLYDPYVAMPDPVRESLVGFYLQAAAAAGVPGIPPEPTDPWRGRFLANAANRLMQALGAFAKLGGRLGRPGFREHIGPGLGSLDETLGELDRCPRLRELVGRLRRLPPPTR
jgi:aminoglycoside/choline kinase family phosphotransferase